MANSGRINFNSPVALTETDLRHYAPSVFAETAHHSRSEKYLHISSMDIVKRMDEAGYKPFGIFQGGCRDEAKRGFTKHMIRFRHESMTGIQKGDSAYEVCLLNSHDGTSTYRLFAGVFRMVCANGLVVCDSRMYETRLNHSIKSASILVEESEKVFNSVPLLNERIGQFQGLQLTEAKKLEFAEQANERTAKILNRPANLFPFQELLKPVRQEDSENDLWTVFNVVQENIIKGGVEYTREGGKHKTGTTKSIRHLSRNTDVNRELWKLSAEFAEAV